MRVRGKSEPFLHPCEHLELPLHFAQLPLEPDACLLHAGTQPRQVTRGGVEHTWQDLADARAAEPGREQLLNLDDPVDVRGNVGPVPGAVAAGGEKPVLLVVAQRPGADARPFCQFADSHDGI